MNKRFDYAKVAFCYDVRNLGEADRSTEVRQAWHGLWEGTQPYPGGHQELTIHNTTGSMFIMEMWGEQAHWFLMAAVNLMPWAYHYKPLRIDWRMERDQEIDVYKIERAAKALTRVSTQLYNKHEVEKKDDRDSGGQYVGIGSPKSARRVNFYHRGKGKPALEYQARSTEAKKLWDQSWAAYRGALREKQGDIGHAHEQRWACLVASAENAMTDFMKKVVGFNQYHWQAGDEWKVSSVWVGAEMTELMTRFCDLDRQMQSTFLIMAQSSFDFGHEPSSPS